jgi:hypothetical protein
MLLAAGRIADRSQSYESAAMENLLLLFLTADPTFAGPSISSTGASPTIHVLSYHVVDGLYISLNIHRCILGHWTAGSPVLWALESSSSEPVVGAADSGRCLGEVLSLCCAEYGVDNHILSAVTRKYNSFLVN